MSSSSLQTAGDIAGTLFKSMSLASLVFVTHIAWPAAIVDFLEACSAFFNLGLYQEAYIAAFAVVAALVLIPAAIVCVSCLVPGLDDCFDGMGGFDCLNKFLDFFFVPMITVMLRVFICTSITDSPVGGGSGSSSSSNGTVRHVLEADTRIQCWEGSHVVMCCCAVVTVVFLILFGIVVFLNDIQSSGMKLNIRRKGVHFGATVKGSLHELRYHIYRILLAVLGIALRATKGGEGGSVMIITSVMLVVSCWHPLSLWLSPPYIKKTKNAYESSSSLVAVWTYLTAVAVGAGGGGGGGSADSDSTFGVAVGLLCTTPVLMCIGGAIGFTRWKAGTAASEAEMASAEGFKWSDVATYVDDDDERKRHKKDRKGHKDKQATLLVSSKVRLGTLPLLDNPAASHTATESGAAAHDVEMGRDGAARQQQQQVVDVTFTATGDVGMSELLAGVNRSFEAAGITEVSELTKKDRFFLPGGEALLPLSSVHIKVRDGTQASITVLCEALAALLACPQHAVQAVTVSGYNCQPASQWLPLFQGKLLPCVRSSPCLASLSLQKNGFSEAMCKALVSDLAGSMDSHHIRRLNLKDNPLSSDAADNLSDSAKEASGGRLQLLLM